MRLKSTSLAYAAMLRLLSAVLCAAALALAACGGDDHDGGAEPQAETPAAAEERQGPCKDVDQPPPRDDGGQKKPSKLLDPDRVSIVELQTSCGSFIIRLHPRLSPEATASFASLARNGFYDDTIFHRIVPGFVIQGGDPTVRGDGGPGYSTHDRVPRNQAYGPGTVAMAKAGNEPRGTGGSQFFVVTGGGTQLTPDYAVIGEVDEGMDVVREIGKLGDPASGGAGTPLQSVVIEKATVREF
jgi:cyclophilin family peptidyl-prolyl cis-trans isomerase